MNTGNSGAEIMELGGVKMLVTAAYSTATGMFLWLVNAESRVPADKLRQILDEVGYYMDRQIPEFADEPDTFTIGALIERIYREQTSFLRTNTTQ